MTATGFLVKTLVQLPDGGNHLLRPQMGRRLRINSSPCQRQQQLVAQAQRLRKRLGDPADGLAELMSTLPPEKDTFWLELAEGMV